MKIESLEIINAVRKRRYDDVQNEGSPSLELRLKLKKKNGDEHSLSVVVIRNAENGTWQLFKERKPAPYIFEEEVSEYITFFEEIYFFSGVKREYVELLINSYLKDSSLKMQLDKTVADLLFLRNVRKK